MGFAVRVRSAGQKYGPTCHQRDRADVTEFATLVRLSSLGQHVWVLALAGYKCRKSALTANPIEGRRVLREIYGNEATGIGENKERLEEWTYTAEVLRENARQVLGVSSGRRKADKKMVVE